MAKQEEVVEETEEVPQKYLTATFPEDSETYKKYRMLSKISGFGPADVAKAGIDTLWGSDQFKRDAEMIVKEAKKL